MLFSGTIPKNAKPARLLNSVTAPALPQTIVQVNVCNKPYSNPVLLHQSSNLTNFQLLGGKCVSKIRNNFGHYQILNPTNWYNCCQCFLQNRWVNDHVIRRNDPCGLTVIYKISQPLNLASRDIVCTEWNRQ